MQPKGFAIEVTGNLLTINVLHLVKSYEPLDMCSPTCYPNCTSRSLVTRGFEYNIV